jgi:hypothetical protein
MRQEPRSRGAVRRGLPARVVYDWARRLPLFARIADSRHGARLRRVLTQAPLVDRRVRFVIAGALELRGIHPYRLRRDGAAVWLRHPVDSWTFGDVLLDGT